MRIQCFIDGYNLYHAVDALKDNKLHWVDLRKLVESYIGQGNSLNEVFFFTAVPVHLKVPVQQRHESLCKALKAKSVNVVNGQFKKKEITCRANGSTACKLKFSAHEEKESDVNLAIQIVSEAHKDNFDIAILITADSDLVPPVKYIKDNFEDKAVWILSPPNRSKHSQELISYADRQINITAKQMRKFIMLDRIVSNGNLVAERPDLWKRK